MSQHFLLSPAARTLSVRDVARLSESEARETFKRIRWAQNGGEPYCPRCGYVAVYAYRNRPLWRCKGCDHQFSVTSDTIFAYHKLPLSTYLLAIALFVNGVSGRAALDLSRQLGTSYKTAFVLAHKIRQAVGEETRGHTLGGEVEVDGLYVGGHVKDKNVRTEQEDRRRKRSPKIRSLIGMRERDPRGGGGRVITHVARNEAQGVNFILQHLQPGAFVYADATPSFDRIYDHHDMARIAHKYRYAEGRISTNQIESFFSRVRIGEDIYRHISGHPGAPHLLDAYAAEEAWRENNRRESNGALYELAIHAAMTHPPSEHWCGYWQRRRPPILIPDTPVLA